MPKIETVAIEALKAARPSTANTAAMVEYDNIIKALKPGTAEFASPDAGDITGSKEPCRAISLKLHAAAKRAGKYLETVTADKDGVKGVFFTLTDKPQRVRKEKETSAAKPAAAATETPKTPGK